MRAIVRVAAVCALAALPAIPGTAGAGAPVTVGMYGNEPLIALAPDGTIYVSALNNVYASVDDGASFAPLPNPIWAQYANSDSSIAVDANGRLYYTFDHPYVGPTAACTTDDMGATWGCAPAAVPGVTDRMWIAAPSPGESYLATNVGLYRTVLMRSGDGGTNWGVHAVGNGGTIPTTGPLLPEPGTDRIFQPVKASTLGFMIYRRGAGAPPVSEFRSAGVSGDSPGLPSAAFTADGALYYPTELNSPSGGRQAWVVRTPPGSTAKTLDDASPPTGTVAFAWVAAGAPGHVGVLYYYTPQNGRPETLTGATWSVVWAESHDADSEDPTWTRTTIESGVHTGAICSSLSCTGNDRFSGDNINAVIDDAGRAHLSWMRDGGVIRYARA